MDDKLKYKFIHIDKQSKNFWSFGIGVSHAFDETYIFINLFKLTIFIGKVVDYG